MTKRCENCCTVMVRKRHPSGKWFSNRRFCSGTCHQRHRKREAIMARKLWESWTRVYLPLENTRPPAPHRSEGPVPSTLDRQAINRVEDV